MLIKFFFLYPPLRKIKRESTSKLLERFIFFEKVKCLMIYQNVINNNLSFSLQINFDIEEMAKFREERLSQPFLLCLMPTNFDVPPSFFLIIDFTYIPCGNDCVSAFKTLFSSFYVFKSKYPKFLGPFYKFFEEAVFSITPSITPTVAAFTATLDSI